MLAKARRCFGRRPMIASALVVAVLVMTTAAHAQEKKVGQVGSFAILKISEKGKFNRCSASKTNKSGMLRIAFSGTRKHYLSVPGVAGSGKPSLVIILDGGANYAFTPHLADKDRASVELNPETVDKIMAAKEMLEVSFAGKKYAWELYDQRMEDVIRAVSNCVSSTY